MLVNSIREMVNRSYQKYKNNGFLYQKYEDEFKEYTRGKTIEDIWRLAYELIRLGYKNKKIMLIGENSYEWAITYMAITGYVGIAVLVDKDYTKFDYDNIFNTIDDISLIIYTESKENIISSIKEEHKDINYMKLQTDIINIINYPEIPNELEFEDKDINQVCEIVFTSGTTANPKAIMLSQKNILVNLENLLKRTPMNEFDSLYLVLPMHHLYAGVHAYLYSYYTGLKIYLCRSMDEMLKDMQLVKPTVFIGVPMIYEKIINNIEPKYYPNIKEILGGKLKYVFCGGAKLKEETKRIYYDNGIQLLDAYGVSEMSSVISFSYYGDEFNLSQGTVFENQKVEIINKDENGIGEIIVTGENMMLGYYHNEAETKKKIDERGFLHTGDLGYLDENNRLFVKGRKQRMIVMGNGKNIYPDEIEKLITSYPNIKKATVYEENHHLKARIVTDENEEAITKIITEINSKLPKYKQIKYIEIKKTTEAISLK